MRHLKFFADDGTEQTPDPGSNTYTLAADTYYAEVFDDLGARSGLSIHWTYDANLVATITVEASNKPQRDVSSYASSGWATTGATAVSPAASAGETVAHYADFQAERMRFKIVVATQGDLSGIVHSKQRGAR